ncbi:MAG: DUF2917 domain-containing protein [Desulfovibrio sp.]|nr:DUF2917 domain-containing protein [Desulfovibrio sp.]MBI4959852.1 DUF2917 domain-containing protein [Desulfovibrio sp.]
MAQELTPRTWPFENRGMVDDAVESGKSVQFASVLFRKMLTWLTPWGMLRIELKTGQTVSLDGPRRSRVECQDGVVWVTCPKDGGDMAVRAGESLELNGGERVTITAMYCPARIILGWK